jgi:hypothetical protein
MSKFRKKPVVIEAHQYKKDEDRSTWPAWLQDAFMERDEALSSANSGRVVYLDQGHLFIYTLEGTHEAQDGDFIIKGVQGELYPCKEDIFRMTYDPVDAGKS